MAYGRFPVEMSRQCIFLGTTNDRSYLTDTTGNRRFWPVKVVGCNSALLRQHVLQLWAEAATYEARGYGIRLHKRFWAMAAAEQESRRNVSGIEQQLSEFFDGDYGGWLPSHQVWKVLGVIKQNEMETLGMRVTAAMRKLGWEKDRRRAGRDPATGKERKVWCYIRRGKTDSAKDDCWIDLKNVHADTPNVPPEWHLEFIADYSQLTFNEGTQPPQ
jgi:predicted P-loop ATPase